MAGPVEDAVGWEAGGGEHKPQQQQAREDADIGDRGPRRRRPRCRLILRFRERTGLYTSLVAALVTSPVHLDAVLDKEGTQNRRMCFSAYMNEKFSMTLMPREMVYDKAYKNYAVEVSEADLDRLSAFFGRMVDRTPYNYSDSMLLMPTFPHTGVFSDTMVQDVPRGTPPESISSVYCSQSAVIACRECIKESPWLDGMLEKMMAVNSRLCSPADVLAIFRPHAAPVGADELECTDEA